MSVLERCRFWLNLTLELALYNAGLELTRLQGSFNISLAFRDGAKIPDSLRHGTSSVIDYGVGGSAGRELVINRAVSLCSIKGDTSHRQTVLTSGRGAKVGSFLWGMIYEFLWLVFHINFC